MAIHTQGYRDLWLDANRTETIEQRRRLIGSALARGGHLRYVWVDNFGKDWLTKSRIALEALNRWFMLASK